MHRFLNSVLKYRKHRASGQAIVTKSVTNWTRLLACHPLPPQNQRVLFVTDNVPSTAPTL